MALLNPTFIFGILVLIYLSSFVLFAVIRILTGISIQRLGYFSLRRVAYVPRDGIKIEIRGLGLNVHRPTFSQPTWLSIVVSELVVTVDIVEIEGGKGGEPLCDAEDQDEPAAQKLDNKQPSAPRKKPSRTPLTRRVTASSTRSETWKQLTKIKERIKRLHRNVKWLRMVDVVATNSAVNVVNVGNFQCGSFTMAVDTRRKTVDRTRFFQARRSDKARGMQQAEWIATIRSVLFTAEGKDSLEILDHLTLNIHGFLYEQLDGLRDASIALKLGRFHIPYDDLVLCAKRFKECKEQSLTMPADTEPVEEYVDKVIQELNRPGSTDDELMQTVSDSKEFFSSILRGIKEVQLAVSFFGITKKIEAIKASGSPVLLNASMKEVGIDMHRLDPKSPAHRMYFPSTDIAHEALAAALSISIGVDDGHGRPQRLMYIPMATTTVRTTLPSKTVEFSDGGSAEQRNANILFMNSVVTSPSVDLDLRHLPLLLAMLRPKPKPPRAQSKHRHIIISRLLPKANIKISMHEPVIRIALPPVHKTSDPDDFDLIISSISSISADVESFHSAVEDLHYTLASSLRVQTHELYYQTSEGNRFDLLETESLDMKVQLSASPDVRVVATTTLQTFAIKMVRPEINDGLRQIVRQLRLDVEPDKRSGSKTPKAPNFLRAMPPWLLHFQLQAFDFSAEVAGVDEDISEDTRGVAIQLESWTAEYRAHRAEGLQRRPARRRASSRNSLTPDADLLKAIPLSPKKNQQNPGDGRRIAIHVRGLEGFIVESADKWEIEPFINVPRFEVAFSTLTDNQGPVFHIHSHIRTVLVQYSLYRHYAIGVAALVLRKAFMRTSRDAAGAKPTRPPSADGHGNVYLSPPMSPETDTLKPARELVTVDLKASLVQIKADMPSDPAMMLQIYGLETGRHRWSPPFFHTKLIRLYAEAPRMQRVWARVVSIKSGRLDYREPRRKTPFGLAPEERMFDFVAEAIRAAAPHELIVNKISDNIINTIKAVQQLHHRFKTGTNEYILEKVPEGPKIVPKISIRTRTLMVELEDGAFEYKLGMIYRAGRVEQMQRLAREEAFQMKAKKIQEEEAKKESSKYRARSLAARGRSATSGTSWKRSRSEDGRTRSRPRSQDRGRAPRYDPDGDCLGMSGRAHVSIQEARKKLDEHNSKSWRKRIDQYFLMARNGMKEIRGIFWGPDQLPDDLEDTENILEVPERPALLSAIINDLHFTVDKPSFPLRDLPDFLHKYGKGMPRDTKYSLLIPMNIQVNMGEARITLRDYPLPLLHVPSLRSGQSLRLHAFSLKTDFVIAEEFRGLESTRRVRVNIIPPCNNEPGAPNARSFAIDVRRTIGPVKSYSDMSIDINTALPMRITWGPSYQPAIQDVMMVIESFTKPQLDPSERVGFWDKIRLNFHSRVRVTWKGDGGVHLALKGTRDPYQVTGNGAGFLMCWRNDVRWNIHADDDPKRFMTVDSGEYILAVPDYSHYARESARQNGEDDTVSSEGSMRSRAVFKKVIMKLSGKVQWMAGLVFEQAIEKGKRNFTFRPHYDVVLKSPQYAKEDDYDAFRGFRSQHIHLSLAVRAPVDRDWASPDAEPSRSYNTVHLTPRFFTHFFAWWSLFGGPMSLPVRQGKLWPGQEKNSKKFGRHLATIKYNLLLAPLFLSHIYKHKDVEDYTENDVSATGIKVRFDSFMLDLHQRREEFNTRDSGRKTQSRTTGMKIHAAQLDLASADVRAVSASIKGTTTEAIKNNTLSTFVTEQIDDGTDLSRFTIPDNDFSWIDMDDFVELDWILPTEPNPDTKILPLAYAPRITYFRQTDIGGVIAGDPDRTSPFGHEPTHLCIMSHDDDPRKVQTKLVRDRLEQLGHQIEGNARNVDEAQLRVTREGDQNPDLKAQLEALIRHAGVLRDKWLFLERMLETMTVQTNQEREKEKSGTGDGRNGKSETAFDIGEQTLSLPSGAEFASDFTNRFVVHNMKLKWNNLLRNIILRYSHQVSQRRGFVYYLSRPAVKFILDIVEEQAKNKAAKNKTDGAPPGGADPGTSPNPGGMDRETTKDIEDRIRKILQDGKRFVNADDSSGDDGVPNVAMDDLTSGIADGFTPQNNYHVRLIAPQIQLQSDKNKKHVVLVTAKGMELKVVEVLDKDRLSDAVSGLVQRRFLVSMDSTQFFVTHQKWFSTQLLSLYSGSTYGTAGGSAWPPWVPVEVMFDFKTDPFGFKRVVQKTSAMMRYDKYNTLRLKYNDEVNATETGNVTLADKAESRMDNLWVDFPQVRALCNSSQYYAIYVIVLDLLMYSEPLEKTRSERLEKIMLASDFSDLRGTPEMVIRLQERIRQLEEIKSYFQIHTKSLDRRGWQDRLLLERDLVACEDELFFMMKAITTAQRRFDTTQSNALLKWTLSAKEIVWHLIKDSNEPLCELQLKDVEYDRTDNSDGSHINLFRVGKILGLNLLPDAMYPEMVAPYAEDAKTQFDTNTQPMIRIYWYMLEAIAGIPVMDHFEVNLYPMKIQLEREVGSKLFEYIFPGMDGDNDSAGGKSDSPPMTKQSMLGDDDDIEEDSTFGGRVGSAASDKDRDSGSFVTRPGSLELRLRPTLNSEARPSSSGGKKALSVHSGDGHSFRFFRTGTGSSARVPVKKPSYESLRSNNGPQLGIGRSGTGFSSKADASSTASDSKKTSRFGLRRSEKPKADDDLTKMISRASNYTTFAYIKVPSVVLCLSYKGKGDRNITDVHDFVFRLPTIEYRNKTWSNLDLALALKSQIIKALISHTGAIIGNKFSKHRPTTAQQSKLRELATSSVLLATPAVTDSRDNSGDDSSSHFDTSPVDFSRSPPRSLRSQSSIPILRSNSRSSSIASSRSYRSSNPKFSTTPPTRSVVGNGGSGNGNGYGYGNGGGGGHNNGGGGGASAAGVPSFLTMTPPTPQEGPYSADRGKASSSNNLLRPVSSGSMLAFGLRPGSSSGASGSSEPSGLERRRTVLGGGGGTGSGGSGGGGGGGGGFLRGKFNALASRLKDREGSSGLSSAAAEERRRARPQTAGAELGISERSGEDDDDDGEGVGRPDGASTSANRSTSGERDQGQGQGRKLGRGLRIKTGAQ